MLKSASNANNYHTIDIKPYTTNTTYNNNNNNNNSTNSSTNSRYKGTAALVIATSLLIIAAIYYFSAVTNNRSHPSAKSAAATHASASANTLFISNSVVTETTNTNNAYIQPAGAPETESIQEETETKETKEETTEVQKELQTEMSCLDAFSKLNDNSLDISINEGNLWNTEVIGVTKPLYRYFINENINSGNNDENGIDNNGYKCDYPGHYYSVELLDNYQIAGFIMSMECEEFNEPLHEYYNKLINGNTNKLCDENQYYYTVDFNELGEGTNEFEYKGIVGYVAKKQ